LQCENWATGFYCWRTIQEPPNAKGRVKILLELLNRPTKIDIPIEAIKVGWIAAAPKA
jgi:hypothetical protein